MIDFDAEVRRLLAYDPETGALTYREKPCRRILAGDPAGTVRKDGYRQVKVGGKLVYSHRIAFFLMEGRWPDEEIDHANGDPSDNRWANLRPARRAENAANLGRSKVNRSGFKGVYWHQGDAKWMARIRQNGKTTYIGSYDTAEEAARAYEKRARSLHGEFARAG